MPGTTRRRDEWARRRETACARSECTTARSDAGGEIAVPGNHKTYPECRRYDTNRCDDATNTSGPRGHVGERDGSGAPERHRERWEMTRRLEGRWHTRLERSRYATASRERKSVCPWDLMILLGPCTQYNQIHLHDGFGAIPLACKQTCFT